MQENRPISDSSLPESNLQPKEEAYCLDQFRNSKKEAKVHHQKRSEEYQISGPEHTIKHCWSNNCNLLIRKNAGPLSHNAKHCSSKILLDTSKKMFWSYCSANSACQAMFCDVTKPSNIDCKYCLKCLTNNVWSFCQGFTDFKISNSTRNTVSYSPL